MAGNPMKYPGVVGGFIDPSFVGTASGGFVGIDRTVPVLPPSELRAAVDRLKSAMACMRMFLMGISEGQPKPGGEW